MSMYRLEGRLLYYFGPPLMGAFILFAIVGFRLVFALPRLISGHMPWSGAALALGAATGAGFVGGAAYVVLGRAAKRVPYIGPYLTGLITVGAYMGALVIAAPYAFGEDIMKGRSDAIIVAGVTAFFGLVVGHSWFRDRTQPRPETMNV
jgi:hypothetical protein